MPDFDNEMFGLKKPSRWGELGEGLIDTRKCEKIIVQTKESAPLFNNFLNNLSLLTAVKTRRSKQQKKY